MITQCAVVADLNRHMVKLEQDDAVKADVEKLATEMILPGGECDPLDKSNLAESFAEAHADFYSAVEKLLRSNNHEGLAIVVRDMSKAYWKRHAGQMAIEQAAQCRV